jgi:hypothetical protein
VTPTTLALEIRDLAKRALAAYDLDKN